MMACTVFFIKLIKYKCHFNLNPKGSEKMKNLINDDYNDKEIDIFT